MEKQFCDNQACKKHTVHMGGKFRVRLSDRKTFCEDCFHLEVVMSPGKNLWQFTTTHFTGYPVEVKSGGHLDALCRQHGVSNHAREHMERNW